MYKSETAGCLGRNFVWFKYMMNSLAQDISALMALGHSLERATELAQADRALLLGSTLCHFLFFISLLTM